jgi:hypothetical protein
VSEARRRRAHTCDGASEAWRSGIVLVSTAALRRRERGTSAVAQARHGAAAAARARHGAMVACSYRWRHERGTTAAPRATRTPASWSASHACSPPARLHRGRGRWGAPPVHAHGGVVHRDAPTGRRRWLPPWTTASSSPPSMTAATFLNNDDFFRSTATTASHLSAWPMTASSSLNT